MQVVAGLKRSAELLGIGGISCSGVEIDHGIESAAGANPVIDGFANAFALFAEIGGSGVRQQGGAGHSDPVDVGAFDHLAEPAGELVGGDGVIGVGVGAG